jgi:hypothetical protein
MNTKSIALLIAAIAAPAFAQTTVSHYDDLAENFYGESFSYNGVTYHSVNNVNGVFPDGSTFEAGAGIEGLGTQIMVENATLLFNDFPAFGSPNNVLTFGASYVVGDNLSLGALSTVTMDLDSVSDFASLEIGYYENGPWGGIVYHLEAFMGGQSVAHDSFSISDLGGRDNVAFNTLSVGGAEFDSLRLYATFGSEFSGPRAIIDNLTINAVPAPGSLALLGLGGLMARRRR